MNKQDFFLRSGAMRPDNTIRIPTLGLERPEVCRYQGDDWERSQVCRGAHYVVNLLECHASNERTGFTRQEDYVKINFWLSGSHTTVLNGFGEHHHERPEVFITAGPRDMVKVDLCSRDVQVTSLALCLQREFFPKYMDLQCDELPDPLRRLLSSPELPFGFYRMALTKDLLAAARAILAAPFEVRRVPLYSQAKAVELLCLLINQMESRERKSASERRPSIRQESRLRDAWELIGAHYSEPITLDTVARQVGLNKRSLTRGFQNLFGMSVYDCLQRVRMERAHELLLDDKLPVAQVAEAVGYGHACNFSTAFHAYFGCTPKSVRAETK